MSENDRLELQQITSELVALEKRYGMSSDEFYQVWLHFDIADVYDYNAWAILVKARNNLVEKTQERKP